jgi:hypothetical protein
MMAKLRKALALGGDTHTVEDIVSGVRSGALQAFSSENAFVVTEIGFAPRKKWLNVLVAAGDLDEVMDLQPQIAEFGRRHDCEFMTMTGRRGWSRVLPDHGWRETGVMYALPLTEDGANG